MRDPAASPPSRSRTSQRRAALLAGVAGIVTLGLILAAVSGGLLRAPGTATPSAAAHALVPWDQLDRRWGTYVPERAWGVPREAIGGNGWGFSYERARSDPYRHGEDGIAGVTDTTGDVVVSWAFWDGVSPHVRERLYGLSNPAGEHGESIVDDRVFRENTPTHSYARQTIRFASGTSTASAKAGGGPAFTVDLEMAKVDSRTLLLRATPTLTSSAPASLHVVVRVRNVAAASPERDAISPLERGLLVPGARPVAIVGARPFDGWQALPDRAALDDDLRGGGLTRSGSGAFGALDTLSRLEPGASASVTVAVTQAPDPGGTDVALAAADAALADADGTIAARRAEAAALFTGRVTAHEDLYRAALGSLLWNESLYRWDGLSTALPRWTGRVDARDVLIMPDKWEYPYLAAWDTGFQAVTAALVDPESGADQLRFLLSDRWQQPDGHVPCAEWVMEVECPPVLAWAAWRVYQAGAPRSFLETVYPGLERQYRYWQRVLQVEPGLYGGGFLGMDNLPRAPGKPQADGSGWMAWFAGWMARIAGELGRDADKAGFTADRDLIAAAVNARLWNETTGLYHDLDQAGTGFIDVPSYVAFIPLIAGIVPADRLPRLLAALRDERGFLGPAGVRSIARGSSAYVPGYAGRGVNSNWRGPVWLPIDYLLVQALEPLDATLAADIRRRTVEAVEKDWTASGGRFHEYFDGDTGAGLGADEQGWTALVANLIAEGWPAPAP